MKKSAFIASAAIIIMASCNLKEPPKVPYEEPVDPSIEVDSTIYGYCGSGSTMTLLYLINNASQDTLVLDVSVARREGKVLGEYSLGDQLYVVPNQDRTAAVIIINENMLLKEWVMPSPYDGSTPSGINLKSGGDAESIDQIDLEYSRWSIINGRITLTETREDASGLEITEKYDILKLTADSLVLSNVKEDETFEYGVRKVEQPVNGDIELDYNTEDSYDLF